MRLASDRSTSFSLGLMAVLTFCGTAFSADEKVSPEERIAKVRADFKSSDAAVRKRAVESQIHSDISAKLFPELRDALGDASGEIRSTAATAIGNLGAAAVPAVPQLVKQLKSDDTKEARETAARALGRIGKAAPEEKSAVPPLTAAAKEDADPVTRVVAHGALAMMSVDLDSQIAS